MSDKDMNKMPIGSDSEIDDILNEIKMHSQLEEAAANEPEIQEAEEVIPEVQEAEPEEADTVDEVMKIVSEEDEPEADEESAETEVAVEEEGAEEEAPESEAEEDFVLDAPAEEEQIAEDAEDGKTKQFSLNDADAEAADEEADANINSDKTKEFSTVKEGEAGFDMMSLTNETGNPDDTEDYYEPPKKKTGLIIAIIAVLLVAIGAGVYFGFFYNKEEPEETTTSTTQSTTEATTAAPVIGTLNPLTGEAGYNEAALGKRPVAVVVENEYSSSPVRPQWGLNEADIVLEGESEYSTRLLLFWADYTNMPEQIGPARSARPPFIRFSQLFDSIFIHAGLSKTKGNYTGADTVFETDNVDHINLLKYSENGTYFGRDKSRTSTIEHTGFLNGKNTAELITKANINTSLNSAKFTQLEFNETAQPLSEQQATSVNYVWSNRCPKKANFTYDASTAKYTTTDFDSRFGKANLEFENLIFLRDTTEYIVKENYKHGKSETYCNYKLAGGSGAVLSQGTAVNIKWGVTNGKLWMTDESGNPIKLNPGKSYIGYGSSNNGGSITIN
ncbi:MAG: DUF3048 domain-containing protein [Ruminococcaceae bacterium]|nr:DUF3048 domain-containing protein [Oscillospiraceae bacterium]